jgi:hypothetical protein
MTSNRSVSALRMFNVGDPDVAPTSLVLHKVIKYICRLLFELRNVRQIRHRSLPQI